MVMAIVNRNFQYTCYHFKRDHIAGKNLLFTQNPVMFAKTDVCQLFTADQPSNRLHYWKS